MTECMNVSSYKDLKVWHKGIEIVDRVSVNSRTPVPEPRDRLADQSILLIKEE